jgi:hypothetical protein
MIEGPVEYTDWDEFKSIVLNGKRLPLQCVEKPASYEVFSSDAGILYSISLEKKATADPGSPQEDFETNYRTACNKGISKRDRNGAAYVAADLPDKTRLTLVTHDFSKKTTWWQNAVKVVGEVTTTSDNLTYSSVNQNWICADETTDRDMVYLKWAAGGVARRVGMRYRFYRVYVNSVEAADGDYSVDHAAGSVTFLSALQPTDEVKVDYYYATTATWKLMPPAGRDYEIYRSEIQFSRNASITQGLSFMIKTPMGTAFEKTYFNIRDYLNTSNLAYVLPASGGLSQDVVILPWDYSTKIILESKYGMWLELALENNQPLEIGELATATLYCYDVEA